MFRIMVLLCVIALCAGSPVSADEFMERVGNQCDGSGSPQGGPDYPSGGGGEQNTVDQ